ncbi:CHAT domain-containing protein [Sphingobacteriales bacterium UPWRP_1]|nr:hypothetical protein B6N25_06020 [Sphingobacteriales bacterium TSM_CSS]PSJ78628.1 CHAT domain-containing protein [Sphingobacteriales bacterium UPWRP_1]
MLLKPAAILCTGAAVALLLAFTVFAPPQGIDPTDSLYETANRLQKQNLPDSAIALFQQAANGYKTARNWQQWFDCINKVREIYKSSRNFQASVQHMQQAAQIALSEIGATDTITARVLTRLGTAYDIWGKFDSAMIAYQQAVAIFEIHHVEDATVATLQKNIGNIYGRRMDYQQATDHLSEALRIRLQLNDVEVAARIYNDLGIVYQNWNDFDKALEQFNRALALLKPDDGFRAVVFTNIAASYQGQQQFGKAGSYLQQALQLFIHQYGNTHEYVSAAYLSMAQVQQQQGNFDQAIAGYRQSLNIAKQLYGDKHRDITRIYAGIAGAYADISQPAQALQYYQNALTALLPFFNDTMPTANPSEKHFIPDPWLFDILQSKGEVWLQLYRHQPDTVLLHRALSCFGLAAKHINFLRRSYASELSKLKLSNLTYSNFERAMWAATQLYAHQPNQHMADTALLFAEQYKAAVLLESVQNNEARLFSNLPPKLLEEDRQLRETLAQTEQHYFEMQQQQAPDDSLQLTDKKLFDLRRKSNRLTQLIEQQYPQYNRLKFEAKTAGIADISGKLLNENTALINYFTADSSIYAIVVTRPTAVLYTLNKTPAFEQDLDTIRTLLSQPGAVQRNTKQAFAVFTQCAHRLYNTLLQQPLAQMPAGINRLIIVPDGKLGYLPFEILLPTLPDSTRADFRTLAPLYLLQRYAISYGASATLLLEQQTAAHHQTAAKLFAGFAPQYIQQPGNNNPPQDTQAQLQGAVEEVAQIAQLTGGQAFLDQTATKERFKNMAGKYKIIHLAMHGEVNDQNPMYSKLLFTQPPGASADEAELNTYELYTMNLNADLAVLSACSTGEGQVQKGEGIMSLSRGFIYAGCPSIVMSLWKAADASTRQIMQTFYQNLMQQKNKDVALQEAKLAFLASADRLTSYPFYWATFVQLGNTQPIPTQHAFVFWLLCLLPATVLAFYGWHQLKRKTRNT